MLQSDSMNRDPNLETMSVNFSSAGPINPNLLPRSTQESLSNPDLPLLVILWMESGFVSATSSMSMPPSLEAITNRELESLSTSIAR